MMRGDGMKEWKKGSRGGWKRGMEKKWEEGTEAVKTQ